MKIKKAIVLAISAFALMLAAQPRPVLAATGLTQPVASVKGESTDQGHKDWSVVLTVISVVLSL